MSNRESSYLRSATGAGIALLGSSLIVALGGCAGASTSPERSPGAQRVVPASCSLRAVVNLRQGFSIRSDWDLVELGRRLGVNLSVLQSIGRNSRIVVIRENGPPEACENSLEELRSDLRIESIDRR